VRQVKRVRNLECFLASNYAQTSDVLRLALPFFASQLPRSQLLQQRSRLPPAEDGLIALGPFTLGVCWGLEGAL
jgi:hypothetical protein